MRPCDVGVCVGDARLLFPCVTPTVFLSLRQVTLSDRKVTKGHDVLWGTRCMLPCASPRRVSMCDCWPLGCLLSVTCSRSPLGAWGAWPGSAHGTRGSRVPSATRGSRVPPASAMGGSVPERAPICPPPCTELWSWDGPMSQLGPRSPHLGLCQLAGRPCFLVTCNGLHGTSARPSCW